jgi:hypothetical protein
VSCGLTLYMARCYRVACLFVATGVIMHTVAVHPALLCGVPFWMRACAHGQVL